MKQESTMLDGRTTKVALALVFALSSALAYWCWPAPKEIEPQARARPLREHTSAKAQTKNDTAQPALLAATSGQERQPSEDLLPEQRTALEKAKGDYVRGGPVEQKLSPEFMADPELYEAGPGPHLERYAGRSGALPLSAQPTDAEVTTVLESEGAFPKLSVWVPSFRNSAGDAVVVGAQVLGEDGRPAPARDVSITIVEKGSGVSAQGVMEKTPAGAF